MSTILKTEIGPLETWDQIRERWRRNWLATGATAVRCTLCTTFVYLYDHVDVIATITGHQVHLEAFCPGCVERYAAYIALRRAEYEWCRLTGTRGPGRVM